MDQDHEMMSTKKPVSKSEDYLASLGRAKNSSRLRDTNEITCVFDAYLTSF